MVVFRVVSPPEPSAEAKVRKLDVPGCVDQDVVRLDVTVDEPHAVNALNRTSQFSNVEPVKEHVQLRQDIDEWQIKLLYLAKLSVKRPSLISIDIRSPPGMYSITK